MNLAELRTEVLRARADAPTHWTWVRRYQDGDALAGRVLVAAHAPMIRRLASRLCAPDARDFLDVVQEGKVGMLRGAARTELDAPTKSYLWWWAYGAMARWLIDFGQCVRLPAHRYDKNPRRRAAREHGRASLARPRTRLFCEMTPALHLELADEHFEETIVDDEDLADERLGELELETHAGDVACWLLERVVDARELGVLRARYFTTPAPTRAEIGAPLGISRERVRQLEEAAIAKLRMLVPVDAGDTFEVWFARALAAMRASELARELAARRKVA